ncbi:hypothetical protein ACH5RR_034363 [Cinchona calisaya]|uniref:Uncharacterized protein n=1 Tax=Cinchona calisaya TaxID=153742 RepID=A0ABD2YAP5_9GENT
MTNLSNSKATKPSFIPILKECISAHDTSIGELLIITQELKDYSSLASYDAVMAYDELISCDNSLKTSKIVDDSILSRLKIAIAYVELRVDIANSFH